MNSPVALVKTKNTVVVKQTMQWLMLGSPSDEMVDVG